MGRFLPRLKAASDEAAFFWLLELRGRPNRSLTFLGQGRVVDDEGRIRTAEQAVCIRDERLLLRG